MLCAKMMLTLQDSHPGFPLSHNPWINIHFHVFNIEDEFGDVKQVPTMKVTGKGVNMIMPLLKTMFVAVQGIESFFRCVDGDYEFYGLDATKLDHVLTACMNEDIRVGPASTFLDRTFYKGHAEAWRHSTKYKGYDPRADDHWDKFYVVETMFKPVNRIPVDPQGGEMIAFFRHE